MDSNYIKSGNIGIDKNNYENSAGSAGTEEIGVIFRKREKYEDMFSRIIGGAFNTFVYVEALLERQRTILGYI